MKIGVCTTPDNLPLLCELGYDYFEANFSYVAALSDEEFAAASALVAASPIKAETFYVFFPASIQLYAPDGDTTQILEKIAAYCEDGFPRAAAWGGKLVVIGSGYVRAIREDMTRVETERQFVKVVATVTEIAARYGMRVVIEPLSRGECNFIHTVKEAADIARKTERDGAGALVDFYHFWSNGEELPTLPSHRELLYHAHFARKGDRKPPHECDEESLRSAAEALAACDKVERISLECAWDDFESDVRRARPLMEIFKTV